MCQAHTDANLLLWDGFTGPSQQQPPSERGERYGPVRTKTPLFEVMKMTLTEAYEAMIKLSQPERLKRYGEMGHVDGREKSANRDSESESETLPVLWQNLLPACFSDIP